MFCFNTRLPSEYQNQYSNHWCSVSESPQAIYIHLFKKASYIPAWGRTAGGGRPEAAARLRSRIVIAAAAAIATHPAPTISARRTVGAPITTGHTPMRVEDPTVW
jgi:hypothetical protein